MPRKIIIDADPGQDDAVAILLALASPEDLEVLGITTVAGNVPLALTSRNARAIRELANRGEVPVFAGAERPLVRDLYTAEYVHGSTGIDGADLPQPTIPIEKRDAIDFIVDMVMSEAPHSITLCPVGPLTNIATALQRQSGVAERLREIVLMGGSCFEGGNTTPAAEFNIYVDPHAADIVFRSGTPITMMPLDVTHQAITTPETMSRLRGLGSVVGDAVAGMLSFYERHDRAKYGFAGAPLHDPCVVAYLLDPGLFSGRHCYVEIEVTSELTMGMTVCDWWGVTDRAPNALVMRSIDQGRFFDLVLERLARL